MHAADPVPAVFLSHGSPMVAMERGPYQGALVKLGRRLKACAVIALSAHWSSVATVFVSGADAHDAIYDFGGFPRQLYDLTYSPPGHPTLAKGIANCLSTRGWKARLIDEGGLDHGVWMPLRLMYPEAEIPVVPLSVPLRLAPRQLFELGLALAPYRSQGCLILGSGGIVHNRTLFRGGEKDQPPERWAREFDRWFAEKLAKHDIASLLEYRRLGPHADRAVPTYEHLAPVFIVLGAGCGFRRVETIAGGFEYGLISMRSFAIA